MENLHTEGSIWRKWDMHIHSPKTFLENRYENCTIDNFVNKIINSGISAIGLTNYFCFNEEEFKEIKEKLNKNGIIVFLNLEFRTQPQNKENEEMHIHLIFSDQTEIKKITDFLGRLKTIDGNYCKDLTSDGIKNTSVSIDTLYDTLKNDEGIKHIRDYLIVACPRGYGNFRPSEEDDGRGNNLAIAIDAKTDIFFGNELDRDFFLNTERYVGAVQKPVLSCSDSHDLSTIGLIFTWIKADLSFDGLKQILYEPADRVKIQQQNPFENRKKIYFNYIKIVGSKNFIIPDIEISLNRELVAIIGGRGSGKSAILESIAFINEEHAKRDQNGKPKIIEFYRQNSAGFEINAGIVDKDNNKSQHKKLLDNKEVLDLPFLYIGQEQLSALATNDKELTKKVCELIGIDFAELKKTDIIEKARNYIYKIKNISEELNDLYKKYEDYKGNDFGQWLNSLIKRKEDQKIKLFSKETKGLLNEICVLAEKRLQTNGLLEELRHLKEDIKSVGINKKIDVLNKTIKNVCSDKDIIPLVNFSVQEDFINRLMVEIEKSIETANSLIAEKEKDLIKLGLTEDVGSLIQSTETIEREINGFKKDRETYKEKIDNLRNLRILRNSLFDEVVNYLNDSVEEINRKFSEFKNSRNDLLAQERDLFFKIIKGISIEGTIIFNQEDFCNYLLENCFDGRVIKNIEDVKNIIAKKNERGISKEITIENLNKWLKDELNDLLMRDILNLDGGDNLIEYIFTNWDDFLTIKTIVKLEGVAIEKLSAGQRGTLLLKIYLATATPKQIFIVDQPEDNLDNQFIMNELVPLLKEIKKSRQIIMSTHNANLVVNSDAEQVLIARLDRRECDYCSGSIENKFINSNIKEILEGGEDAFRNRENKYGMKDYL